MNCFHDFTAPLWELFVGNLLFLLCSIFYLIWWVVCFRPHASGAQGGGGVFLALAFLTGIAALILLSIGINTLSAASEALPVWSILLGAVALYLLLLLVTTVVFHRQATSELLIMVVWGALELSVITVLCGSGRFNFWRTAVTTALVGIAMAIGLVCYVLYYRLDGTSSYIDGMVPLAVDGVVMAVLLGVLATA